MIDIVMCTTRSRPKQLEQTIRTLKDNAYYKDNNLMVIVDSLQKGIGWCKNTGAMSFDPNSRRLLMFTDDDFYYLPQWDKQLIKSYDLGIVRQLGGWGHYYNQPIKSRFCGDHVIHTVHAVAGGCCLMSWQDWQECGPFNQTQVGPAKGEDWELSQSFIRQGYQVGVRWPYIGIHTGIRSSNGEFIVGHEGLIPEIEEQVRDNNINDLILEG